MSLDEVNTGGETLNGLKFQQVHLYMFHVRSNYKRGHVSSLSSLVLSSQSQHGIRDDGIFFTRVACGRCRSKLAAGRNERGPHVALPHPPLFFSLSPGIQSSVSTTQCLHNSACCRQRYLQLGASLKEETRSEPRGTDVIPGVVPGPNAKRRAGQRWAWVLMCSIMRQAA